MGRRAASGAGGPGLLLTGLGFRPRSFRPQMQKTSFPSPHTRASGFRRLVPVHGVAPSHCPADTAVGPQFGLGTHNPSVDLPPVGGTH